MRYISFTIRRRCNYTSFLGENSTAQTTVPPGATERFQRQAQVPALRSLRRARNPGILRVFGRGPMSNRNVVHARTRDGCPDGISGRQNLPGLPLGDVRPTRPRDSGQRALRFLHRHVPEDKAGEQWMAGLVRR